MKKALIVGLFLLVASLALAQMVRVATWNMERLGDHSNKDYAVLAQVVQTFDLVGCIEVIKPSGLENALKRLPPEWRALVSKTSVGRNGYNEYYGFLWNTTKVALVADLGYFSDEKDAFVREPYGAMFEAGGWRFTLVLSHILFGNSGTARRAEIARLGDVYSFFRTNGTPDVVRAAPPEVVRAAPPEVVRAAPPEVVRAAPPEVIIGGDFNEGSKAAFANLMRLDGVTDALGFGLKTTLGLHGPASDYDHIFLSQRTLSRMVGSGEFDFVALFEGGDYSLARSAISDHLPVWVELRTESSPQGD